MPSPVPPSPPSPYQPLPRPPHVGATQASPARASIATPAQPVRAQPAQPRPATSPAQPPPRLPAQTIHPRPCLCWPVRAGLGWGRTVKGSGELEWCRLHVLSGLGWAWPVVSWRDLAWAGLDWVGAGTGRHGLRWTEQACWAGHRQDGIQFSWGGLGWAGLVWAVLARAVSPSFVK